MFQIVSRHSGKKNRGAAAQTLPHLAGLAVFLLVAISSTIAQSQKKGLEADPACQSLVPASVGGAMPKDPAVMAVRYLGTSNYEVDYQGKVILLDAFYDGSRGPDARLIGLKASDVTHADAIYIGHPHVDHIADAPSIAKRLNAPIFVAPAGRPVLERQQVPPSLVRYVTGGESIRMDGYTVMTALARHSDLDPKIAALYKQAAGASEPPSAAEMAYAKNVVAGYNPASTDPVMDIPSHGTIAYVFVFDDGFKLAFRDSPGTATDGERALVQKLGGSVDLAILGYNGFGTKSVVDVTLKLAELYNPKYSCLRTKTHSSSG
jgi:hypothetical protein